MRMFEMDSPFMRVLNVVADLLWLNILTAICCIPIFTVGASLTAMHYMALKIVRGEETYLTKGFFKSFKQNFRQGTIIWLILLAVLLVLGVDYYVLNKNIVQFPTIIRVIVFAVIILVAFEATFVFPVLAKFDNTVVKTMKNAFMISILQFPKTILMIVVNCIPVAILFRSVQLLPLALFFGISAPAYLFALLYNSFFEKLEVQIIEKNAPLEAVEAAEKEEAIFHDHPEY